jgi:hypothetical protein
MLTANSGDGILIAEGPGPGSVRRQIFKDQAGNCYQTYGYMLRTSVSCPSPKSAFLYETELTSAGTYQDMNAYRGVVRRQIDQMPLDYRIAVKNDKPYAAIEDLTSQLCHSGKQDSTDCVDQLFVLGHGNPNVTFGGSVAYDQIQSFFGGITFCRPCTILLNSCLTGATDPSQRERKTFAERVRQVTGCDVLAPETCVVKFGETAYVLDPDGINNVIKRGWDCFRRFRVDEQACEEEK